MTSFTSRNVIAMSAVLASGMLLFAQSPANAEYEHGPVRQNGCYNIGDERVKFVSQVVDTNDDVSLKRIASSISRNCDITDRWDDKWYYWTLPGNRAKYLLLTWKNLNSGEYGYAFIHNTPDTWWFKSDKAGYQFIHNGSKKKITWTSNGYTIQIDIKNPKHENGWTGNDIWYSFGY